MGSHIPPSFALTSCTISHEIFIFDIIFLTTSIFEVGTTIQHEVKKKKNFDSKNKENVNINPLFIRS